MSKFVLLAGLMAVLSQAAFANALSDKVEAMSENGRRAFIGTLIRQSGGSCADVQRVFFQGRLEKAAVWNARCGGNTDFGVIFYDDQTNTTRVLPCVQLKELGAPRCFTKL